MTLIFLNLLRLALWSNLWCSLDDVPCALRNYSAVVVWSMLQVSVQLSRLIVLSRTSVFMLISVLVPLPLIMSGVLKLPLLFLNYIFLPSILLFLSHIFRGSVVESVRSVQFSRSVVSDSLWPHGLQHTRPPCPSPIPRVYSNSCPLSWLRHPTITSSVLPFSHLQSFPTSGSFQMSQLFTSGGQNIGVLASTSVPQWTFRTDFL